MFMELGTGEVSASHPRLHVSVKTSLTNDAHKATTSQNLSCAKVVPVDER